MITCPLRWRNITWEAGDEQSEAAGKARLAQDMVERGPHLASLQALILPQGTTRQTPTFWVSIQGPSKRSAGHWGWLAAKPWCSPGAVASPLLSWAPLRAPAPHGREQQASHLEAVLVSHAALGLPLVAGLPGGADTARGQVPAGSAPLLLIEVELHHLQTHVIAHKVVQLRAREPVSAWRGHSPGRVMHGRPFHLLLEPPPTQKGGGKVHEAGMKARIQWAAQGNFCAGCKPDQTRPDQSKAHQTRPGQTTPNQTRADQTTPDQSRADQTRLGQTRPDQSK